MYTTRSRWRTVGVATLLASAVAGLGTGANAQNGRTTPSPAANAQNGRTPPPVVSMDTTPIPITLYEDDVFAFIDQPTEHLIAARSALARNDRAASARELAAAAANMRIQAGYSTGTSRSDMLRAARDVDDMAAKVRASRIRTLGQLDDALGHTNRQLAANHIEQARRAWDRREVQKAGLELRAAANATERAARAAGRDTEVGARTVVHGARVVSGKLIDGAGWTVDEVGKGIADLGRAVERIGRKVDGTGR